MEAMVVLKLIMTVLLWYLLIWEKKSEAQMLGPAFVHSIDVYPGQIRGELNVHNIHNGTSLPWTVTLEYDREVQKQGIQGFITLPPNAMNKKMYVTQPNIESVRTNYTIHVNYKSSLSNKSGWVRVIGQDTEDEHLRFGCMDETLHLKCQVNRTIHITKAVFSPGTAINRGGGGCQKDQYAPEICNIGLPWLFKDCNGKQNAKLLLQPTMFQDLTNGNGCTHTINTLYIIYKCDNQVSNLDPHSSKDEVCHVDITSNHESTSTTNSTPAVPKKDVTPTSSQNEAEMNEDNGGNSGALIGGVISGIIGAVLVVMVAIILYRRKTKRIDSEDGSVNGQRDGTLYNNSLYSPSPQFKDASQDGSDSVSGYHGIQHGRDDQELEDQNQRNVSKLYAKPDKLKKSRIDDLYSKPNKTKKNEFFSGNTMADTHQKLNCHDDLPRNDNSNGQYTEVTVEYYDDEMVDNDLYNK